MNKRAIWVIIGLMSAALIGIIILQVYWINWSYQLSERQFSKDVYASLNRVVDKLQRLEKVEEDLEVFSVTTPGTAIGVDFKENGDGGSGVAGLNSDRTLDSLEQKKKAVLNI